MTYGTTSAVRPVVATTTVGHLTLPPNTGLLDRERVAELYQTYFRYLMNANYWVRLCVNTAEELQRTPLLDREHYVVAIAGKRTREQQLEERRARQRIAGGAAQCPAAASPFAVAAAGHHAYMHGNAEVSLLTQRTLAVTQRSAVIIKLRDGGLQDIPIEHRAFDALYHVLIHPTGECGWEDGMVLRSKRDAFLTIPATQRTGAPPRGSSAVQPRTTVSMMQYYAHRLHFRAGPRTQSNCLFMMSRLYQEYMCVAFWRIEAARLNIHRLEQAGKFAARQRELRQYAAAVGQGQPPPDIGRVSYIPESFTGGPNYMYARYLDAMAAVLSLGPPSLFVTMTANPKWPEVQSSLAYGQKAEDRPDVITRVFHAKVLELVKDLEHQFGQTECIVRVIEFQMRGLPHAHIVVIMKAAYRPRTGAQIDSLATAELPPMPPDDDDSDAANVQRRLRALVLEHMVHNDCTGAQGRRCPCYDDVNKRCRGRFPYEYVETTSIGDGKSKPTLRRRRGGVLDGQLAQRSLCDKSVGGTLQPSIVAEIQLPHQCGSRGPRNTP